VWLLGGVSLLNDFASEAIYPLLPFFLTSVLGATALSLGIIEGVAEAVSSVLKIVSGRLSDRWRRRRPIVISGYALSSVARPLISIANGWIGVFTLRFIDRVGKGIRSAPRDALLISSLIGGSASDRRGRRPVIALGWTIYALVYAGFAVSQSLPALVTWFLIYGVYYGCAEGTERALVADFAGPAQKGTAFGVYNAVAGFGALAASVVFGLIWKTLGPSVAFACGSTLALAAAALLFVLVPSANPEPRTQNQQPEPRT
jgi:MFS family permease